MISKSTILSIARQSGLLPTTVEEDYVLGWVLSGISRHPEISKWIFKGGTCLKKCFFDTYRFSRDLDFTIPEDADYDASSIRASLIEIADWVSEETGIEIPHGKIEVKESENKRSNKTFILGLKFRGPLNHPSKTLQGIKFDLTSDEVVVEAPELRHVFDPYNDAAVPLLEMRCYTINEMFAEKTRAIYERKGRSKDVYDVVNISRNFREEIDVKVARDILAKKFDYKDLPSPTADMVLLRIDVDLLKTDWENSLRHQLRLLPPVEEYIRDLSYALRWLIDAEPYVSPAVSMPGKPDKLGKVEEQILPKERFAKAHIEQIGVGVPAQTGTGAFDLQSAHIETIRYAARNRLCAMVTYKGIARLVEPYSLRRAKTGDMLLYAYELERDSLHSKSIKAFKVLGITNAVVTERPFIPRYVIEL